MTISEVNAFAEKVKAALLNAETDRRTVAALTDLVRGEVTRRKGRIDEAMRAKDGKVLAYVRGAQDGARVGDMIKSLKINRKALARALARLRDEGSIKMVGKRRLARYLAS